MKRLTTLIGMCGAILLLSGIGMRVYARADVALTEQRLLAAKPDSLPDAARQAVKFTPASAAPNRIALPALGLWNTLEPVGMSAKQDSDDMVTLSWDVADAGWYTNSAWPGWNGNVVIAGHSPSQNAGTWTHSIFRQLAYLHTGDLVEVSAGNRVYTYRVAQVFAVSGSESSETWLARGKRDRLTLITCWPPNTAAYRVIALADPEKELMQ